jgi:hypothetical protein
VLVCFAVELEGGEQRVEAVLVEVPVEQCALLMTVGGVDGAVEVDGDVFDVLPEAFAVRCDDAVHQRFAGSDQVP